jgi:hypothetical protein
VSFTFRCTEPGCSFVSSGSAEQVVREFRDHDAAAHGNRPTAVEVPER